MALDTITISPAFEGAARVGILDMRGLTVGESPEELKAMLNGLADEFARKYKDEPLGEIPAVKAIRAIFHRSGLDPTRYRPSSESLLRRAVKGKGLYFINSVVDLINYFSLKMLCPMGLYDADKLKPPIVWRVGPRRRILRRHRARPVESGAFSAAGGCRKDRSAARFRIRCGHA